MIGLQYIFCKPYFLYFIKKEKGAVAPKSQVPMEKRISPFFAMTLIGSGVLVPNTYSQTSPVSTIRYLQSIFAYPRNSRESSTSSVGLIATKLSFLYRMASPGFKPEKDRKSAPIRILRCLSSFLNN